MEALESGLKERGLFVNWRSVSDFNPRGDYERGLDAVAIGGLHFNRSAIRDVYQSHNKPVIIADFGYLNRVNAETIDDRSLYWQLSLNDINQICPDKCPQDRFKKLGINLNVGSQSSKATETVDDETATDLESTETLSKPKRGRKTARKGDYILVAGQTPKDKSHGLSEDELNEWYTSVANQVRLHTDKSVLFRPHPSVQGFTPDGFNGVDDKSLDDSLKNAHAVITYCSNIGHDALIAGVPVFAMSDRAPYLSVANTDLSVISSPKSPSESDLIDYLSRVAYSQWTLEEIATGEAIGHLMKQIK